MDEKETLYLIGRNICAERNRANLSQEGLAEKIGISPKHLSKIENGKINLKTITLITIMETLDIPFEALYRK